MSWWQNLLIQSVLALLQILNQRFGGGNKTIATTGIGVTQVGFAHLAKRSDPST